MAHPLGLSGVYVRDDIVQLIAAQCRGDARRALNALEVSVELARLDNDRDSSESATSCEVTNQHVEHALGKHRWNQRQTAKALGLSYDQIRHAIKKHGLMEEQAE